MYSFSWHWILGFIILPFFIKSYAIPNSIESARLNVGNLERDPNQRNGAVIHSSDGLETIVIVGSNDLHGAIFPIEAMTKATEAEPSIPYQQAGMATLGGYIKNLRQEFGNRLLWLDGGDEFQGSFESNSAQGAMMVKILNQLHLDAATIGNHEFDFGQPALQSRMQEAKFPYLAANLFLKNSRTVPKFPHLLQSTLLPAGPLKVGIIGLTTTDTPTTTNPDFVKNLDFTDLRYATELQAQLLRQSGAQLVVLVGHVGLTCSTPKAAKGVQVRTASDLQGSCQDSGEMVRLLAQLPAGTVDAVVSGHTHQIIHHFLSQGGKPVPVIQGGHEGQYLNLIYLTYDVVQKRPIPELTRIEGPIPICAKIFANQKNCSGQGSSLKDGRGMLVTPRFHGQTVVADEKISALLLPLEKRLAPILQEYIGTAARTIDKDHGAEPALGNLVTDAMRDAVHADVAITNPGSLRAPLYQGPITFGQVFRALPFDNKLCVVKIPGALLTQILKEATQKSYRPFSVSGVSIHLRAKSNSSNALPQEEQALLSGDRVLNIQLDNGTTIQETTTYRLAVADFILKGGSALGTLMKQIDPAQIQCDNQMNIRDLVVKYIRKESQRLGSLNSKEHPLLDFDHRRISITKSSGSEF